jgi:hypothetical protein
MKIIITENTVKNILIKLFDKSKEKYGRPVFDPNRIKMVGLPIDDFRDYEEYREQFIQYIGGIDKAINIANEIVDDLIKEVIRLEFDNNEGFVDIKIKKFENYGREFSFNVEVVGGELEGEDIFDTYYDIGFGEMGDFMDYLRGSIEVAFEPKILNYSGIRIYIGDITFNDSKLEDTIDESITCENCGWSWKESESEPDDLYNCHKCGYNNEGN